MKGYKIFNPDWTCRDFQYEVGKTYEMAKAPIACNRGFHFCLNAVDCFSYYNFDPKNKVAEVEALGECTEHDKDSKIATNKIHIIRELNWGEVLTLVNFGSGNTGMRNSGNRNSGNRNSGDCNSGDWNSGYRNSGDRNSGNRNSGNWNSGDCNSGDRNSGNRNSGNWNSGDCNSGYRNSGDCNSGDCNSGYRNSGDRNSGNRNSGNRNSGDCNSGDCNSGDCNSGDCNSTNYSSGVFCTEEPEALIFDKPSGMTLREWRNTRAADILWKFQLTKWINSDDMTEEEKAQRPSHETTGGYLKTFTYHEAWTNLWTTLDDKEKEVVKAIPNFDPAKFLHITGIDVTKED